MVHKQNTSPALSDSKKAAKQKKRNTNWHEAASCAVQIELREYSHLLQFLSEYVLGRNSYRIDLLVVRKLSEEVISKNIARIFKTYNLFEIKGISSCLNTDAYYKTIGYAGLLISQSGARNQYTALDITLTFLSFHYPKKLIKHLQKDRKLTVEKFSNGVYYIIKEIFCVQIIVIHELSADENLYLRCLTDNLQDAGLINRLTEDYNNYQEQDIYIKYMNQLTNANSKKGASPMVCEGILRLCGTSSEEIIERTKKEAADYYVPMLNDLSMENEQLSSSNEQLTSQIDYLKNLLKQHNIQFD